MHLGSSDCYLAVMFRVIVLGRVSVPPGPKVTVPLGWTGIFLIAAVGVTIVITVMVDGGLAPFFLGPPRVEVMQTIWLPPATGVDAEQEPVPLLSNVGTGGLGPVMVKPVGRKIVSWTFGVGVVETLLTFHVMLSGVPTFGVGLCGVPVTETGAEIVETDGRGTVVVMLALALGMRVPAASVPLATAVLRTAWLCICTMTVMVDDVPGAITPWLQVTVITPAPPEVHVPWLVCATTMLASGKPSTVPEPLVAVAPAWA